MTQRGLVIFLGGTGCGKTTSMAAMVDYRNGQCQEHIITIEDPIEFSIDTSNVWWTSVKSARIPNPTRWP